MGADGRTGWKKSSEFLRRDRSGAPTPPGWLSKEGSHCGRAKGRFEEDASSRRNRGQTLAHRSVAVQKRLRGAREKSSEMPVCHALTVHAGRKSGLFDGSLGTIFIFGGRVHPSAPQPAPIKLEVFLCWPRDFSRRTSFDRREKLRRARPVPFPDSELSTPRWKPPAGSREWLR